MSNSNLIIRYNLSLKRNETKIINLPDLKSSCFVLRSFELSCDNKSLDIKLNGKDTIISYSEAVLYQSCHFDLSDKLAQIIDSEKITCSIKNLTPAKEMNIVNIAIKFIYSKIDDGNIIFNQFYSNLNPEGLINIINDIIKAGKHITKIIWVSPNKLSSIKLIPQFETTPTWLTPITELSNNDNQIIMDLTDDKYDIDFVNQLTYYTLYLPDDVEKIGVIVYGYHH